MDFVQSLDPSKLLLFGTGLAFFLELGASPSYNLPIYLFGYYVQENTEAVQSLQTFTGLLGISVIFDLIWMLKHEQHGFFKILTVVLQLLKIPTFFTFVVAVRQRGGHFSVGPQSLAGPTVWSMPGGFTSNRSEGYQNVDEPEPFIRSVRPVTAARVQTPQHPSVPPQPETTAPGAYQTV